MHRVRDISSKEYHLYIRQTSFTKHLSHVDIEKALSQNEKLIICHFATEQNPNPLPSTPSIINRNGDIEYPCKDNNYWTFLDNKVYLSISKAYYKELFIHCMVKSGFRITIIEDQLVEKEIKSSIRIKKKRDIIDIRDEHDIEISKAKEITPEEREELENKKDELDVNEKNSIIKFDLCKLYEVDNEDISPEFVKAYNKPKQKKIFKAWKDYPLWNKTNERFHKVVESIEDIFLHKYDNLKRKIVLDLILKITGASLENCFNGILVRNWTLYQIGIFYDELCNNKEQTKILFNENFTPNKDLHIKMRLEFVNKILHQVYGIKIVRVEAIKDSNYKIMMDNLFIVNNRNIKVNIN